MALGVPILKHFRVVNVVIGINHISFYARRRKCLHRMKLKKKKNEKDEKKKKTKENYGDSCKRRVHNNTNHAILLRFLCLQQRQMTQMNYF